jgi:micrococcal nuclease
MRSRNALLWLAVLAVVAALGGRLDVLGGGDGATGAGGGARVAQVVRVVDGDTIKVRVGAKRDTVRYIGVDTPESVKPGTPVQCFAKAASTANAQLVSGRRVRLVADREPRDRYGRLLAYVYRADDGRFVNAALVSAGYARTLTIRPNDRFASRFAALQSAARARGRGLWGAC